MKTSRPDASVTFEQRIPSLLAEADSLCLKIRSLLQANEIGAASFPVELLARECLNNAVLHGIENDAERSILLRLWLGRKWIRLEVSDQGPGFDWRNARNNGMDTSVSSGRGLHLYALYAERVRFNRRGNQITLWVGKKNRIGKEGCAMAAYVIEQKDQQGSVRLNGDLTAVLVPGSAGWPQGDAEQGRARSGVRPGQHRHARLERHGPADCRGQQPGVRRRQGARDQRLS